jgi:AcrR family transcriptional regulator
MSRRRLSREETREQTTQRLLDAAEKVIARKGLDAASVEDIAETAGYSRGAFYSNFSGKEDLFIELLRRDHQKHAAQFDALRTQSLTLDQLVEQVVAAYSSLHRDNECFMNWTEARLLAVRDARFRAKLNALLEEKRAEIGELIGFFYARLGINPPLPPQTIAFGCMSLAEGIKLAFLSNPTDMSPASAEAVMALFLRSIIDAARARATAK